MDKKKIIKYILRTYIITWIFWGLRALLTSLNILDVNNIFIWILYGLGSLGPTISAISLIEDKSLSNLKKIIFNKEKNTSWILLVFTIIYVLAFYLSTFKLVEGTTLIKIVYMFIVMLIIGGGNEEIGWRGVLQEELEKKYNTLVSSLIITIPWSLWHIPFWFTKGDMHVAVPFITFYASLVLLSIVLGSIKKNTKSIFYCMIMHAIFNILSNYVLYEFNIVLIIGFVLGLSLGIYLSLNKKSNCN